MAARLLDLRINLKQWKYLLESRYLTSPLLPGQCSPATP